MEWRNFTNLNELSFSIEQVDPAVLWGSQNENFNLIKKRFPTLKLVARGSNLKALGDAKSLEIFQVFFDRVLEHILKYNRFTTNDLESFLQVIGPAEAGPSAESESESEKAAAPGKEEPIVYGPHGLVVRARTPNQRRLVESVHKNDIVFAIGPAGTGKTYTAVALAVRALRNREIKRIILTRPAVEAGENLGFLPGDLKEKIDPYLRPLYDALDDMIPPDKLRVYLENRTIEIAPLAFMRGRTLDKCFVILDEAQNATDMQLKMFLTRMGPTAKFIVTGDVTQIDLPKKQQSGLTNALKLLDHIEGIDVVRLDGADVVRHKLVRRILEAYGDI